MTTNNQKNDLNIIETQEWLESLQAVLEKEGPERAHFIIDQLMDTARRSGINLPYSATTSYVNTIPTHLEARNPGDTALEDRIRALVRWNAMAMVVRANNSTPAGEGALGGHLSSFQSLATLISCGMHHFWHAESEEHAGDLVFFQGHSCPGIYSQAYLEGTLPESRIDNFRQEVDGKGVPSYPHPKLLPDFWQFPTVSMGLGPLNAIYQARFLKYLDNRGIADTKGRKVWCFCGDGEMDEPEARGAISLAAREHLDNLIFVVNCNLQRLDGPVRGNGKIIQELEGLFRGAGWRVLKVIWGGAWDKLFAQDKDGVLLKAVNETLDGDFQTMKAHGGAYMREHFFGKDPRLAAMVANMSDSELEALEFGGHDANKVYAAYAEAIKTEGQPTLVLAKTVKGYGMGQVAEAQNPTHQQKKLDVDSIRHFRDRFPVPVTDEQLADLPFVRPSEDSPEIQYMLEHRKALGGSFPHRRQYADEKLMVPELSAFAPVLEATPEGREISTTQAFVRFLNLLLRDKTLGERVVPIMSDESRTFGMEGLFRQIGIYSPDGQNYEPVDRSQVMYYKESKDGQLLQEGINEAGAISSWTAAGTSYSSNNRIMIPFFIFYSMFGFQRVGDLAWAAGDMQARGFLLGGTSGRTTLNGEGLQHQDGHGHILASTVPNCVAYDPTFAHELAVILRDGLRRMVQEQENVFYYVTVMNENYAQPGLVEGDEEGILKGMYKFKSVDAKKSKGRVQLLGSGSILMQVLKAQELLEKDWGVSSDVWSVTSFTELGRDGNDCKRHNMLNPTAEAKVPYVTTALSGTEGPIVASTDYVKMFSEQIRPYLPEGRHFHVLGTDGYGRSDYRAQLRKHFEVDCYFVTIAALKSLADEGKVDVKVVEKAIQKYGIDTDKTNPRLA